MVGGVCRRLSALSVTRRICNVTYQGAARGGPVVLRPVRSTLHYLLTYLLTMCLKLFLR